MRRIVVGIITVIMVMAFIAGCGKDSAKSIVGTWSYDAEKSTEDSMYIDIGGSRCYNEDGLLEFMSDGRLIMNFDGTENALNTYEIVDEKLIIVRPLGTTMVYNYSINSDSLTITDSEGRSIVFKK